MKRVIDSFINEADKKDIIELFDKINIEVSRLYRIELTKITILFLLLGLVGHIMHLIPMTEKQYTIGLNILLVLYFIHLYNTISKVNSAASVRMLIKEFKEDITTSNAYNVRSVIVKMLDVVNYKSKGCVDKVFNKMEESNSDTSVKLCSI